MDLSLFQSILLGLGMGFLFGFALEKSRVFEPGVILAQMQLKNFTMLKVVLTAVVVGLISIAMMSGIWGVSLHPKSTMFLAQIVGGLLLGAGMVISGACPGTVLAQIGAGYTDAWFILLGGLGGALTFSYVQPQLKINFLKVDLEKFTLNQIFNLPYWAGALLLAILFLTGLILLERAKPWKKDLSPELDS